MDRIGNIKGVLFDLDQTLTDRHQSLRKAADLLANHFAGQLRPCSVETIYSCLMRTDARGFRRREVFCTEISESLPWKTAPSPEELFTFWQTHFPKCTVERPGAVSVIRELAARSMRIGVVANGDGQTQNEKIDVLGIRPYLSCVIIEDNVGIAKPNPAIYQLALEALKLPPSSVVFVGENPRADVIVPQSVGMKAVWLSGVFDWPVDVPPPAYSIRDLSELPALI